MATIRDLLRDTPLLDLGPLPAPRLPVTATVQQALFMLVRGRRGAVVLLEGMRPAGIFTERDVLVRLPEGLLAAPRRVLVREVMSRPPVTARRQTPLAEVIGTMARRHFRHVVVVDRNDELRGMVTTGDIVQFLTDQFPEETVNLPPRLRQVFRRPEGA